MKKTRGEVRILLVGDKSVGKTSLILSLVSEAFPIDVPARAEEITIPAELTPEKVVTCIVDFSSVEQNEKQLTAEIERADVICVVYAVDEEDTLASVTDHWLPLIRSILGEDHRTPVILVGNKVDMIDYSTMESVMPIMNEYDEIETCVECSARNLKNISEMFYFAQKAVLHPSLPLWNYQEKDLTEPCKKALTMIFKICDLDNDGVMSDEELGRFQRKCFNMDLEMGTLDSLKTVVMKNCPEGIQGKGLTLKGFLTLNSLFIQRGRHETTWTILRKFGYNDDIQLEPDALVPALSPGGPGSIVELTHAGAEFLIQMFKKHDKDEDGALSPQELVSLFSTCPSMPWGPHIYNQVVTNHFGWIGRPGYIALWHLEALLNPEKCRQTLAYLGYDYLSPAVANKPSPLTLSKEKQTDLAKRQSTKSVYSCLVIGPRDSGKTTFCQTFLGKECPDLSNMSPSDIPSSTINAVTVYGQLKHLVLLDRDILGTQDELSPRELNSDVVCLLYDSSNPRSFELCARLYLRYFSTTEQPVLVVGNKCDLNIVRQDYIMQPELFCTKHKLPPPQLISCVQGSTNKEIFIKLATMAAFPGLSRLVHAMIVQGPNTSWFYWLERHLKQLGLLTGDENGLIRLGVGVAVLALGGAFAFKYFNGNR